MTPNETVLRDWLAQQQAIREQQEIQRLQDIKNVKVIREWQAAQNKWKLSQKGRRDPEQELLDQRRRALAIGRVDADGVKSGLNLSQIPENVGRHQDLSQRMKSLTGRMYPDGRMTRPSDISGGPGLLRDSPAPRDIPRPQFRNSIPYSGGINRKDGSVTTPEYWRAQPVGLLSDAKQWAGEKLRGLFGGQDKSLLNTPTKGYLNEYKPGGRSAKTLDRLHPDFQKMLQTIKQRAFDEHGLEIVMIDGRRSRKAQETAVRVGNSNARWGQSPHNHGVGLDFGFKGKTLDEVYRKGDFADQHDDFQKVGDIAKSMGLAWGGDDGVAIDGDYGHIEPPDFNYHDYPVLDKQVAYKPEVAKGYQAEPVSMSMQDLESLNGGRQQVQQPPMQPMQMPQGFTISDELGVRQVGIEPRVQPTTPPSIYKIKQGDTLSEIAKANGMTVKELQKLNNIKNVNKIKAGQEINVDKFSINPTPPLQLGRPTGYRTTEGRLAFENNFGGMSTEYSIGVRNPQINNGQLTHIPSIWGGKVRDQKYAEDMIIKNQGIDPETGRYVTPGGNPEERSKGLELMELGVEGVYSPQQMAEMVVHSQGLARKQGLGLGNQ